MEILEAMAVFAHMAHELEHTEHEAVRIAVEETTKAAKDRIGEYHGDTATVDAWPPLAPSTVDTRVQQGYSPDEPLLRSGELRDSIEGEAEGSEGYVGSPLDKALYAEVGTATEPARSWLEGGFYDVEDKIMNEIGDVALKNWMNW